MYGSNMGGEMGVGNCLNKSEASTEINFVSLVWAHVCKLVCSFRFWKKEIFDNDFFFIINILCLQSCIVLYEWT